jgi:hypothetical protein
MSTGTLVGSVSNLVFSRLGPVKLLISNTPITIAETAKIDAMMTYNNVFLAVNDFILAAVTGFVKLNNRDSGFRLYLLRLRYMALISSIVCINE